ncbi:hypothetical protein [Agromyces sp. CCNWLW203]|uniref:hypothetical protein n=1 Tax=Agromyces sp. CCNWLW203 TaxID=3112842 RepID=UPI002F96A64A
MSPSASSSARAGRLKKAIEFRDSAELIEEFMSDADRRDAYVTLCVHAGIAAADVICMDALGEYYSGPSHDTAAKLLAKVDTASAKQLATLLGMKTKAGYSDVPVSNEQLARAKRAMEGLVDRATK